MQQSLTNTFVYPLCWERFQKRSLPPFSWFAFTGPLQRVSLFSALQDDIQQIKAACVSLPTHSFWHCPQSEQSPTGTQHWRKARRMSVCVALSTTNANLSLRKSGYIPPQTFLWCPANSLKQASAAHLGRRHNPTAFGWPVPRLCR
jgi:hypothetical protein